MDLTKDFKTDRRREIDGAWETLDSSSQVLVARLRNEKFNAAYARVPRGTRRMFEKGTLSEEQIDNFLCKIMAKSILLDWKGIEFEGKPLEYSVENSEMVLKALPDFRIFIWELADDFQRFHDDSVEEDIKNLTSVSVGK